MGRKPIDKERINDPLARKNIIDELAGIYLKYGFEKFTMNTIAKKLGLSKATLYRYFASKEEILQAIVELKIQEIEHYEKMLNNPDIEFFERFFKGLKDASLMLAEISGKFLYQTQKKHPELFNSLNTFQDRSLEIAAKFYRTGIELGYLKDCDVHYLSLLDKMIIQSLSNPKFLKKYDVNPKEMMDFYYDIKTEGLIK